MIPSLETCRGFLYAQYIAGLNPPDAYSKLLSVTGNEIFSLEQVEEFFEAVKNREFSMSGQKSPKNAQLELPYILKIIPEGVLKYCDLRDRLTLRNVSRECRHIIDTTFFEIDYLVLECEHPRRVDLFTDTFHSSYVPEPRGFTAINDYRQTECARSMTIGVTIDLLTIFANSKLEVSNLHFEHEHVGILNVFSPRMLADGLRRTVPKVCKISGLETPDLEIILPVLDPVYLVTIEMVFDNCSAPRSVSESLAEMEQWRNSKELITNLKFENDNFMHTFAHFDYCDFIVEDDNWVSMEELVELKDTFLLRPTFQKFEIIPTKLHAYYTDDIFDTPPAEFLPFQSKENPEMFEFKYPDYPEKMLTVTITENSVLFKGPCYSGDKVEIENRRGYVEPPEDDEEDEDN